MRTGEVDVVVCDLIRHVISGTLSITIGVRNSTRKTTETNYIVRPGADDGSFDLVRPDGEIITVSPGGSCTCPDNKYRRRVNACKHVAALRMAGLLLATNQGETWTPSQSLGA